MNSRRLLSLALLAVTFALGSCKDDEDKDQVKTPPEEFVFGATTISLKDANLYRISNSVCCNNHSIRAYVITDGVYSAEPGSGWDAEDYTGETYHFIVTLLEPDATEHGPGEYPMYPWWGEEAYTHERMSYVDLFTTENGNIIEYLTGDDRETSPVVVSGGLNFGEKMTISFKGQITHRINTVYQPYQEAKINFSGTVQDVQ
jgi:hypothetical protein